MARTIQSPGVEIQEIDLSLRNAGAPSTVVFVPGFASKGPSSEPISVTSLSEFEQIFGQPTNSPERYFYHSVRAVLQSPATPIVYRLPYGAGAGVDTSDEYSALVYPVKVYSASLGGATTNLTRDDSAYFYGEPTHLKLTQSEYLSILKGDAFSWNADTEGATTFNAVSSLSGAGMIILNKGQSTINTKFEGIYVGTEASSRVSMAHPYQDLVHATTKSSARRSAFTAISRFTKATSIQSLDALKKTTRTKMRLSFTQRFLTLKWHLIKIAASHLYQTLLIPLLRFQSISTG